MGEGRVRLEKCLTTEIVFLQYTQIHCRVKELNKKTSAGNLIRYDSLKHEIKETLIFISRSLVVLFPGSKHTTGNENVHLSLCLKAAKWIKSSTRSCFSLHPEAARQCTCAQVRIRKCASCVPRAEHVRGNIPVVRIRRVSFSQLASYLTADIFKKMLSKECSLPAPFIRKAN